MDSFVSICYNHFMEVEVEAVKSKRLRTRGDRLHRACLNCAHHSNSQVRRGCDVALNGTNPQLTPTTSTLWATTTTHAAWHVDGSTTGPAAVIRMNTQPSEELLTP
jgi:hypothetical protein